MRREAVVVTGIGMVCPLGHTPAGILESLREQRHNFQQLTEFSSFKRSKIHIGTKIPDFDTTSYEPEDWSCPYPTPLSKETIRGFNPHTYYAYHASLQAINEAGLTVDEIGSETGLFTASPGSTRNIFRNLNEMHTYGVGRTNPFGIINSVAGTLSWNLGAVFKIRGASCGFASACASSTHALGFAYDQIALGREKRILVTAAEDGDVEGILPFAVMHALSPSKDVDAASLPFDRRRRGFVGCGGATTMILESADSARERGAKVLAELSGWGQASDGYKPAAPLPDGSGLAKAIEVALDSAGFSKDTIGYINAHATGTISGDLAEISAIRSVFGNNPDLPISSTKALTGHGLSYAGIMESALSIRALRDGFIPGTANLLEPTPEAEGLNLPKDNLESKAARFISNSSGFGGANVCLAFQLPSTT